MTSARLYGDSLPYGEAVAEIERCAGSQFDPDVVNAFLAGLGARAALSA
jgi:HD-GYP domain-containing protein (c-di-GMP phosphodiesterase class II)